jgi:hypothetical protein
VSGFCNSQNAYFITVHRALNIFERKVYRRIVGPVYENVRENLRILTNTEMYAVVKNPP